MLTWKFVQINPMVNQNPPFVTHRVEAMNSSITTQQVNSETGPAVFNRGSLLILGHIVSFVCECEVSDSMITLQTPFLVRQEGWGEG